MKNEILDDTTVNMDGHVLIKDIDTGEILLDKHNAINFENMSKSIAYTMIGDSSYSINEMRYGNSGSVYDQSGYISYKSPNVNDSQGALYQEVHTDDQLTFEVLKLESTNYADIVITSTVPYATPLGQNAEDIGGQNDNDSTYIFDELGLVNGNGEYLTHIVFHPIEKSSNRRLVVTYTLRVKVGG